MGGWMDGWQSRFKDCFQQLKMTPVFTYFAFCTEQDQIHTVIWHSLLFCAKKYGTGWMDGQIGRWMDGWADGRAGLKIAYSNQKLFSHTQDVEWKSKFS